ncbi:carbohydrate ABC transporter permease [Phytoactinopolyspora alkaliphila]|uniref:Carbohydrate ABC transporter permease n=1 Tax=Phytoactinopolyspora alkaliphila TaxID=1783498 RepID=A0A6N9YRV1_9ACTN|nr:carbohydrate ABC transporter permease [Phytoactinopolyspora alkaliphila]NED97704.1 carbohydrate ABC transporter permease [Phytoactinopolyspora alkaliphila]
MTAPTIPRGSHSPSQPTGHKGPGRRRGWLLHLGLLGGLILVVTPFVWMILGSFKTTAELRRVPPTWLPEQITLSNYQDLFERLDFGRYFFNSALVATAVTVGNLVFCSMLGYALAKLRFPGRRPLFLLVLTTLMVPGLVTFMPLFVLVANMGLVNTHAGLALPFVAQAFGVFLMRQFIIGIPDDLLDAARIDGAGEHYIFWRIVIPLTGPALATLAILMFLGSWNNFLWPLVVATTEDMYTLPVAIALFSTGQHETNLGLLMAGSAAALVPVLVVFVALQRFFTQGIAMTGIK